MFTQVFTRFETPDEHNCHTLSLAAAAAPLSLIRVEITLTDTGTLHVQLTTYALVHTGH